MLALARLQRKFRLLESPYRTPQTLVGGPRSTPRLMAVSGRTAATKAMGKGSTQYQHLVQTEVPTKLLEEWLDAWARHYGTRRQDRASSCGRTGRFGAARARRRSTTAARARQRDLRAIQDRRGRSILSVRDQNTFDALRKKRLMTLIQLFLIHRYKAGSVHYLTPTDDNQSRRERMKQLGIFAR